MPKDRRSKKYFNQNVSMKDSLFKHNKTFKNILITCDNFKEKFAVRDSYRIISDFYEKVDKEFAKRQAERLDKQVESKLNPVDTDKTDDKQVKEKPEFLSQQIKIKAKGLVFVKLNDKLLIENFDIVQFVNDILDFCYETHEKLSKHIFRFIPVEVACLATMDNFKIFMKQLIDKKMPKTIYNHTFSLIYKCRNNNKFVKGEFFDFLEENIPDNYRKLDYNGDYSIIVDITVHFMCLTITKDFIKYNRYSMTKKEDKPKQEVKETETKEKVEKELEIPVQNNQEDVDLF